LKRRRGRRERREGNKEKHGNRIGEKDKNAIGEKGGIGIGEKYRKRDC
jgi:hypothetical protein